MALTIGRTALEDRIFPALALRVQFRIAFQRLWRLWLLLPFVGGVRAARIVVWLLGHFFGDS